MRYFYFIFRFVQLERTTDWTILTLYADNIAILNEIYIVFQITRLNQRVFVRTRTNNPEDNTYNDFNDDARHISTKLVVKGKPYITIIDKIRLKI